MRLTVPLRVARNINPHVFERRVFTVKGIYSTFPASLIYYSPRDKFSLYDCKEREKNRFVPSCGGVNVADDGLVYPGIDSKTASNGARMYPNVFTMQEAYRTYYDNYSEAVDAGVELEKPYLYTIPKGTPIPARLNLVLIHERACQFSLQPSCGTSLQGLNRSLDEFFAAEAIKEDADGWLDNNPFNKATHDSDEEIWMSK